MLIVYTFKISSCLFVDIQKYKKYVSKTKLKRINSYKNYSDFVASFMADVLLLYAISSFSKSNLFNEKIYYGKYGKPFVKIDNLYFSISHSGDYIVCIVSKEKIGVDIQKKLSLDSFFLTYLDEKETEKYTNLKNDSLRNELLVKHWVLRESYLKYTGKGLFGNLKELHFEIFNRFPVLYSKDNSHYFWVDNFFDLDYILGICTDVNIGDVEIVLVSLDDFDRYIDY